MTKGHALRFFRYFDLREAFEIAKLGFPESSLAMFIFLMELAINTFTLNTYAVAGVASVAVVVNVFEFILYLSEGISEYEIVAVNDSIGEAFDADNDFISTREGLRGRLCCSE